MQQRPNLTRLTARDLSGWLTQQPHALILDARDALHHAQGNLPGSVRLDGRNHELYLMREPKDRPVFIYCYHGNASQTYAAMFADFGFKQVCDLIGGWEAWQHELQTRASSGSAVSRALPPELRAWLDMHGFVDVDAPGKHGNTPLMHAAWLGDMAVAQALLNAQVDLHAVNNDGNNALWLACVSNQSALVTLLAHAGVKLDHGNLTGATCLMYAASSSKPQIVQTLLDLGADPHLQSQDDFTALDMAGNLECLTLLRAATRTPKPSVA